MDTEWQGPRPQAAHASVALRSERTWGRALTHEAVRSRTRRRQDSPPRGGTPPVKGVAWLVLMRVWAGGPEKAPAAVLGLESVACVVNDHAYVYMFMYT